MLPVFDASRVAVIFNAQSWKFFSRDLVFRMQRKIEKRLKGCIRSAMHISKPFVLSAHFCREVDLH